MGERGAAPPAGALKVLSAANPIPVKWVMQQMGLIGPELRLPLTPLSERFHERLREAMHAAGL